MFRSPILRWFDRNPKKTALGFTLCFFILCDFLAARLLLPNTDGLFHPYYHHGLQKNQKNLLIWGSESFYACTNSLGLKDNTPQQVTRTSENHRILFIGDSFTEGIGYPYEKTFVGMLDRELAGSRIEVFNAGVRSYSPKLYYLKTRYLLEEEQFEFDELYVYIDISDIQDEIVYESFNPQTPSLRTTLRKIDVFWRRHAYTYHLLRKHHLKQYTIKRALDRVLAPFRPGTPVVEEKTPAPPPGNAKPLGIVEFYENYYQERPHWTTDADIFRKWGEKGLRLARENMEKLLQLCEDHHIKMTLAVYPWPEHIRVEDRNSMQVRVWKQFAQMHRIDFIDYFPDFIGNEPADRVIQTCFIPGDVHWNETGHKVIARRALENIRRNTNTYTTR